jgi:hypothetical protein
MSRLQRSRPDKDTPATDSATWGKYGIISDKEYVQLAHSLLSAS